MDTNTTDTRAAIVVLGQSLNPDGSPPSTLLSRVRTAAEEWRADPSALMVLSGGDPARTGISEAEIMLGLLREHIDVNMSRCVLEAKSNTTVGNAVLCLPTLEKEGVRRVRLVSSEFHLPRARYLFEAVLVAHGMTAMDVIGVPVTTPPPLPTDVGVNAKPLSARLTDEERYVSGKSLARMLDAHNPTRGVPLHELGPERQQQVQQELGRLRLREAGPTAVGADSERMEADDVSMHGLKGVGRDWMAPAMVTKFDVHARTTFTDIKAHEYRDDDDVLLEKVKMLATMIKSSRAVIAYTGAGISTAAGIDDYATKAKGESVTAAGRPVVSDWKLAKPTRTHRVLASMHTEGLLHHWVQQNHDSLPQKAGYPQQHLNEIHGSLHDPANPVVPYEGSLRDDLFDWMHQWQRRADLCLALGTSMSGFNCDSVPATVGARFAQNGTGMGLVVVNLQQTPYDDCASLRIFAKTDEVFTLLAKQLELTTVKDDDAVYRPRVPAGRQLGEDVFLIPFDPSNARPLQGTASGGKIDVHEAEHDRSDLNGTASMLRWDLRTGRKVKLTGGPYEGDIGQIMGKNEAGDYRIRFENSVNPTFNVRRRPFSLWMGSWWVEMATNGRGIVPGGKLPFFNVEDDAPSQGTAESQGGYKVKHKKYEMMCRLGIADDAIRQKMLAEGVPAPEVERFFGRTSSGVAA